MKKIVAYFRSHRLLASLCILLISIAFYMILDNFTAVGNLLSRLISIINPLLWGAFLAYLLDPIASFLEKHVFSKMKKRNAARTISIIITVFISLSVITLCVALVVPQLISSVKLLIDNIDGYLDSFRDLISGIVQKHPQIGNEIEDLLGSWEKVVTAISSWIGDNIGNIVGTSVKVGEGIFNAFLAIVFMIYMLFDKASILRLFRRIFRARLSDEKYDKLNAISVKSNSIFKRYLVGNITDALIIGVLNFIFMSIFGMPYALLISLIVCVTNLIPTFGPIIGAVPSLFILLLVEPSYALWFLIWTIVLQLSDSSLIKPWLFGDSTGLSPLGVLAAIIIGGRIFGIVGMFLAVPVAAIIAYVFKEYLDKNLERNGCDSDGNKIPAPEAVSKVEE
ncbi:MAG: AI-2E family transporter [Clostridiales bacterium]|nr:AI-2E family transporter [Clostridiales bacterium]